MNLIVRRKHTKKHLRLSLQYTEERHNLYVNGGCQSAGQTTMANCGKKNTHYPASRFFSLAWLLAFTKSFASLVSLVVGLFYTPRGQQPKSRFQTATLPALFQQSYITLRELAGVGE